MQRKAKIVATIGPASQDEAVLERLIGAGMNVARLNFSHGTHAEHAERIAAIRRVSDRMGLAVGILQDLQGPKIRVGYLAQPLQLAEGEVVSLYAVDTAPPGGKLQQVPVDFRELFDSVHPSDKMLLDDGRLALEAVAVEKNSLTARVTVGGLLLSHKGINLPGVRLRIPGFTEKDQNDLAFGVSQQVDAVAVSFVRSADDVRKVRSALESLSKGVPMPLLIAKLEKPEAVDELEAILSVVDGVMVARGDLGVELPPERVPGAAKADYPCGQPPSQARHHGHSNARIHGGQSASDAGRGLRRGKCNLRRHRCADAVRRNGLRQVPGRGCGDDGSNCRGGRGSFSGMGKGIADFRRVWATATPPPWPARRRLWRMTST